VVEKIASMRTLEFDMTEKNTVVVVVAAAKGTKDDRFQERYRDESLHLDVFAFVVPTEVVVVVVGAIPETLNLIWKSFYSLV
jgi:hypothetical protein